MTERRYFWSIVLGIFCVMAVLTAMIWMIPLDRYMDNEFASWQQQKDYVHRPGEEREILFLGDSVFKAAVLPEEIAPNAYNLALGGATPLEMYYSLRDYFAVHPAPQAVFLAFSPVHYMDMESYHTRNFYFHFLGARDAIASQLFVFQRDDTPWRERPGLLVWDVAYLSRVPMMYYRTIRSSELHRDGGNREEYGRVASARGHKYFGLTNDWLASYQTYEVFQRPFVPLESLHDYLVAMIRLCQERGVPVFVLQDPMQPLDYAVISQSGYLADYEAYMDRVAEETGVPVEREIPVYDVSFFGDFQHVNEQGAMRYSHWVRTRYGEVLQ